MRYSVVYSCGHSGEVELFGKETERRRRLVWLSEHRLCPDCYREKLREETKRYSLPDLIGSEKQVAWAERVRSRFLSWRKELKSEPYFQNHAGAFDDFCGDFFNATLATTWIDRSDEMNERYEFCIAARKYIATIENGEKDL